MARDSRSRNRRNSKTVTKTRSRVIDGGTRTDRVYGDSNRASTSKGVDSGRAFSTHFFSGQDPNYGGYSKDGHYAISKNPDYKTGAKYTLYDGRDATFVQDTTRFGRTSVAGGYLEVKTDKPDKRTTETYQQKKLSAKDRMGESDQSQKSKQANIKKKGRSGLRIQQKAQDPSAGRLKPKGKKPNQKPGTQGGGSSGLNIPQ